MMYVISSFQILQLLMTLQELRVNQSLPLYNQLLLTVLVMYIVDDVCDFLISNTTATNDITRAES